MEVRVMDSAYLSLQAAASFLGRSPRWIRRRITEIQHFRPPASGLMFRREDLVAFMQRFRVEPVDVNAVVAEIFGPVAVRKTR
jgi:hypothetical protein